MKFILETPAEEKHLTFEDVAINQFFVVVNGALCQKINHLSYIMIASNDGTPYADYFSDCHCNFVIDRILPHVRKIEF